MGRIRRNQRYSFREEFHKRLFSTVLEEKGWTLKELSSELEVNYWTLKKWRYGAIETVPGSVLLSLIDICDRISPDLVQRNINEVKSEHWGQKKGGKKTASQYTAEQLGARMSELRGKRSPEPEEPCLDNILFGEDFYELLGIFMGDGCLSQYTTKSNRERFEAVLTGHREEDERYYRNRVLPLLDDVFSVQPSIREDKKENVIRVHMQNKTVFRGLEKVGMPIGKKIPGLRLSREIMNASWNLHSQLLRGLFDTDGNVHARKDEDYRYPYCMITSASNDLLNQLKSVLREQGIPAYIHADAVIVRGKQNTDWWMEEIGSSHPITNKRLTRWKQTGELLPKRDMGR